MQAQQAVHFHDPVKKHSRDQYWRNALSCSRFTFRNGPIQDGGHTTPTRLKFSGCSSSFGFSTFSPFLLKGPLCLPPHLQRPFAIMFKRVAKATSKKADVDDLKDATGDDTAVGIDRLVDESSSSEGEDSDGDDDDDDSEDENEEQQQDVDVSDAESSKMSSKRKRSKDQEQEQDDAEAQVSIADAIQDPIYVPTEGEKKHGVFASRCIICETAVLKTANLVTAHLEAKAHKRRMERFQKYVEHQLSDAQRKALDARDAVEQMDDWKAEQDELERKTLADAPPSKKALAKKQKAAEFRQKKKEQALKRKAKKAAEEGNGSTKAESTDKKKAKSIKADKSDKTGTPAKKAKVQAA